ncbi:MAG: 50S ribosomal protein L6 [Pseudomonadota bacterium]
MSRIGKKPIPIPGGVTATLDGQKVEMKGPKGVLSFMATDDVTLVLEDGSLKVAPRGDSKRARQQWGMSRSMVDNLVVGVTQGFKKELEISGVGYRAQVQGKNLKLSLGYSHDVEYPIPDGITITCPKPTEILVEGIDKQQVGEVAAKIRKWRPPEPFKGKGVKYKDEYIFRKDGKKK